MRGNYAVKCKAGKSVVAAGGWREGHRVTLQDEGLLGIWPMMYIYTIYALKTSTMGTVRHVFL